MNERARRALWGIVLKNTVIFRKKQEIGFDYILNPTTGELHYIQSNFFDSHNLHLANLEDFIGVTNVGLIEIHLLPDGTKVPIYDLCSGELICEYAINKCKHCFHSN